MQSIRRILVAVKNPRAKSLPAVAKAAQLARALQARVQLFHAIADPVYVDVADVDGRSLRHLEQERRRAYQERLENLARRLRRHIKVDTAVSWDFPAYEAVLRAAAHFKADLIISECHPTRHRAPWLLRFTDWELLRMSPIPVLLVKSRRLYHRPKVLAAIDPSHAFSKPAKLDDEVLRYGAAVAGALRGALHAVHAYDPMPVGVAAAQLSAPNAIARLEETIEAQAHDAFDRALRATGMRRERRHLVARHPIDAIQETAQRIGSSIVVMGAVSRSGLKRLFIGNTAERLLDQLDCDLLIVKPRGFASHVARAQRGPQLVTLPVVQPWY